MSQKPAKTVLLVEDNLADVRFLREMLNEAGPHNIKLIHACNLSEAEEHLAQRSIDIILLDLGLPDAQGLAAVRRARATAPRVPVVVLDDEHLAAQALQAGAQDYLIKGQIETRGLLRALRYAIERQSMEDELRRMRSFLDTIIENVPAMISMKEAGDDRKYVLVNRAAERFFGIRRQGIVGKTAHEVFSIVWSGRPSSWAGR